MRKIVIFFFLLLGATSVEAQTISLIPIAPLSYCVGDSIVVRYQASGSFASDNYFFVELSNSSGSFSAFTSLGNDTSTNGSIGFKLSTIGSDFQVKVASTDPYAVSASNGDSIHVLLLPQPNPLASPTWTLLGHSISMSDSEAPGTSYVWTFNDSDASIHTSQQSSLIVNYSTEGTKSGSLMVTSPSGCMATANFFIYILSCNPVIPSDAFIVTGNQDAIDTRENPHVWVKSGGKYDGTDFQGQNEQPENNQFIYVEPGASVVIGGMPFPGTNVYYIKTGASIIEGEYDPDSYAVSVLDSGLKTSASYNFYCPDLTFDYSQIQPASVAEIPAPTLSLIQSGDHLFANSEETPAEIRILNILGAEVLSQHGTGVLDIDLSPLPAGVYFAQVQSGDEREVRKIAVVH